MAPAPPNPDAIFDALIQDRTNPAALRKRVVTDHRLTMGIETHSRGSQASALGIREKNRKPGLHHANQRIRRTKVNTSNHGR